MFDDNFSRRERQIMNSVYQLGSATAEQIRTAMPDPPGNDAVRRMIRILEEKGYLRHEVCGRAHIYFPTQTRETVQTSALEHVVSTFFKGSASMTISALLDSDSIELDQEELDRLETLIQKARKDGR